MLNTKTKSNEKSMKMGHLYIPGLLFFGVFLFNQEINLCTEGPLVFVFLLCLLLDMYCDKNIDLTSFGIPHNGKD